MRNPIKRKEQKGGGLLDLAIHVSTMSVNISQVQRERLGNFKSFESLDAATDRMLDMLA